jgi:8-oxo-dGTP pyrophosphatase MutT (NUDIX family)
MRYCKQPADLNLHEMDTHKTVAIPKPAATVLLVRDAGSGIEVLMMRRNAKLSFAPGAYVFPGGSVDDTDCAPEMHALCSGLSDGQASRTLGVARGGLGYWVAAMRETFEEAGLLVACDAGGRLVAPTSAEAIERLRRHRDALNQHTRSLTEILRDEQLLLAADQLVYYSHWITPEPAPRRYDTRFFVAVAPSTQAALHDNQETVSHLWARPAEALDRHQKKEFNLRFPTKCTLEELDAYSSVDSLMTAVKAHREIPAKLVRLSKDGKRLLPGDAGYEELAPRERQGVWQA